MGLYLGGLLSQEFSDTITEWKIDYIIPVPLHTLKKSERGYNQSYYISKGLSKKTGIPVVKNLLSRNRYTSTQTTLNKQDRKLNIEGAFRVKSKRNLKSKNILILDDVVTTGATTLECARQIKKLGADKIFVISVALAE
ncbi:MAG: ComF family protein [Melioribacteraceae bacterium]|nr:ComF family protein [Melioribacteraceae bacterium]MCF8353096.1 ComF family protein [Melioribacteraceae bacterium]MCF8392758.1 ComF family protein [Melioribacteraceae bacterium]MCF8418289.1 ComF family protein [Melioribacteraceae bacterium]